MTPQDVLKKLSAYEKKIKESRSTHVAVGLPKEKATGKIYEGGQTVLDIAAHHEFGTNKIPKRSFLRMPHSLKSAEINKTIKIAYKLVMEKGWSVKKALGLVGVKAVNVSQEAFETDGFGKWESLTERTISKKGSSKPLFDTGTLKNSITYKVRSGR